jgi:hypothetical protein
MFKDKPAITSIKSKVNSTIESIANLPPDALHYVWDADRLVAAQAALVLALDLLTDEKDLRALQIDFTQVRMSMRKVAERG